jgi:hypothetical protein
MLPSADGCRIQYTRGCWAGEIVCRKNVRWRKTKERRINFGRSVGISRLGFFAFDADAGKKECENVNDMRFSTDVETKWR